MVSKEEFITDLEHVVDGTLGVPEFQEKYLLGSNAVEVEGVTDGSAPNLAGNLGHLVAVDDKRETEEFKKIQKKELQKLIQLLKSGAPASELDKFHFYGETD